MQCMDITVRPYTLDDIPALHEVQRACFPPPYPAEQLWSREQLESHIAVFPAGALCAEVNGLIVGSCTSLIIHFDPAHPDHTWDEVADGGFLRRSHQPNGNSLYGIDMAVIPEYRGRGVARAMYRARYELVAGLGLERFLAAGRMPGYAQFANDLTPEEYASRVIAGELTDPVITPQIRSGLRPLSVIHNYIPDEESRNCAILLEWLNPGHAPATQSAD